MINLHKHTSILCVAGFSLFTATLTAHANQVAIGDVHTGGIKYHLGFSYDAPGSLVAVTGQTLPSNGAASDRQDFANDLIVDEVGVKSWRDSFDPDGTGPIPSGQYGWALNSRWNLIDLNGLAAHGYTQAQVSITLEADSTGLNGSSDLIPGLTAWQGLESTGTVTGSTQWFPNGSTSTNWNEWWATDLTTSALNGQVWWAADDANNPIHTVTLTLPWLTLNGVNDYLTVDFGGNKIGNPTQFNFANFKATVSVAAVPVPASVWLFGSALVGLSAVSRRKQTATM